MNVPVYQIKHIYYLLGIFILLVLLFIIINNKKTIFSFSVPFTIPKSQPEFFTELYFTHHLLLKRHIAMNQPDSFEFTITNREEKDTVYPYRVQVTYNNAQQLIDQGIITIKKGNSKVIKETYSIPVIVDPARILVTLPTKNELIAFTIGTVQADY